MGTKRTVNKILIAPLLGLIYVYKYVISPLLPASCRHYPTCSSYTVDALRTHGLFRGSRIAANRISRCHPWGTSGFDPVPQILVKKVKIYRYSGRGKTSPSCNRLKDHP